MKEIGQGRFHLSCLLWARKIYKECPPTHAVFREVKLASGDITRILEAVGRGERMATEELLPLVYDELRTLASQKMARESDQGALQPTALVHEVYMRLVENGPDPGWENRGHFFAAAAEAMRRILIEAARRRASLKRGGGRKRVELPVNLAEPTSNEPDGLLALDEALEKFKHVDPDGYKLVMLRYFAGLTVEDAAVSLGVSSRTAKRNWSFARAWLQRELRNQLESEETNSG